MGTRTAITLVLLATTGVAQTHWRRPSLDTCCGVAMTWDDVNQRVLAFGGRMQPHPTRDETWLWDGAEWTMLEPPRRPPARTNAAIAWDDARRVAVLFGGQNGIGGVLDDTWEWDGATWTERLPSTRPAPALTETLAMAYDRRRGRCVLVTSADPGTTEVWEWDGNDWQHAAPASARPSSRWGFRLAYDAAHDLVLLTGGARGLNTLGDTWSWDGIDWVERARDGYGARWEHTTVFDERLGAVVLHAGAILNSPYGPILRAETFAWDGAAWTQLTPPVLPDRRAQHAMAYDRRRQRGVVFGGSHPPRYDTWEFDGTQWTEVIPVVPGQRIDQAAAGDLDRRRIVLFGGRTTSNTLLGDTWEWDGAIWRQAAPQNLPKARDGHAMAFDAGHGVVVLFGGLVDQSSLWQYDGVDWYRRFPQVRPVDRRLHAMAHDRTRDRVVVFGGLDAGSAALGDTWEWDGTTLRWTERMPPSAPAPRSAHAMAWDDAANRVVLFGGTDGTGTLLSDTWEWDGSDWRRRTPASSPPARRRAGMVYDETRLRTVLFGGRDATSQRGDTWEWDGTDWLPQAQTAEPEPREVFSMAWDGERVVLYGGAARLAWFPYDVWVYEPAVRADVQTHGAGCPGSAGVPVLAARGAPILGGRRFALTLGSVRARTPVAVWIAGTLGNVPLPVGCTLYIAAPVIELPATSDASGSAELPIPIPALPALRGAVVVAQGAALDPNGALFGVAALSQALLIRIGD